ncbi:MAG: type II secretion system F family protein [Polyangia bacterium]
MSGAILQAAVALAAGAAVAVGWAWLWSSRPSLPDFAGERGERLQRSLARHPWLRPPHLLISAIAAHLSRLPLGKTRARIELGLERAGYPLGLDADGALALGLLAGLAGSALGAASTSALFGSLVPGALVGLVFGAGAVRLQIDDAARERLRAVRRSLPQAIDLAALAMQAGLDMPGAFTQVAEQMPAGDPLRRELEQMLRRLSVGWSRDAALRSLAERVRAPEVRQLTSAVIQADRQGTPLSQVLAIQARVMRTRRSQAAEQRAARAAVLLLGPLMLIFTCVFLLLLGPFVVKWFRGELI